jgi:hypothetical protein
LRPWGYIVGVKVFCGNINVLLFLRCNEVLHIVGRPVPPLPLVVHLSPRCDSVYRDMKHLPGFNQLEQVFKVPKDSQPDLFW